MNKKNDVNVNMAAVQQVVDAWISQYPEGYWPPEWILARLTEEVGELSRELNHLYGPKKKKAAESNAKLQSEIGDVLFTIVCLANSEKIDLAAAFRDAMEKCYVRDVDRFEKK